MLVVLPSACLVLALLYFHAKYALPWRQAFLASMLVCGLSAILGAELLSQWNMITAPAVAVFWAAILVIETALLGVAAKQGRLKWSVPANTLPRSSALLLSGVVLYVLFIGLIAVVAPPNTWDSMEYHMPKAMHWIQHQNISFYPTAVPRQNHQSPGAELFILHLQVLSGSDRFANLVEWLSMAGCLAAITLIAKELGAGLRGQVLAAVFVVTLPMGIMQASSTQTDYVIALWLSSMVYFMLRLMRSQVFRWPYLLAVAAALALGVLTKATIYLYAFAFLGWMVLVLFPKYGARMILPLAALAVIVLSVNAGHYARNYRLHGNPLGPGREPEENTKYSNDTFAPQALASGAIRNVCTHLNTPWPGVNRAIGNAVTGLHRAIGWDVNDRRTTWGPPGRSKFSIMPTLRHDEVDGNPVHLLILLFCGVSLLASPQLRKRRDLLVYSACVMAAFLAFSCYIKWSPWNARVHMSVFVLAGAVAAVVLENRLHPRATIVVAAGLLLLGLPWVLSCKQRPVLGEASIFSSTRDSSYFNEPFQRFKGHYFKARQYLEGRAFSRVGIIVGNQSWEYMWWVFLRQLNPAVQIQHVNVEDVSRRLTDDPPFRDFQPDAVITADQEPQPEAISVGRNTYHRQWAEGNVAIYFMP